MTASLKKQLELAVLAANKRKLQEANKASARELLLSINLQVSRMVSSVEKMSKVER